MVKSTVSESGIQGISERHQQFGFNIMGPILAECCQLLHRHLDTYQGCSDTRILFCTRGGLIMHQALRCYLQRTYPDCTVEASDLHVSRLAAARVALDREPAAAVKLLQSEFAGRSCAAAASVLAGFAIDERSVWSQPCDMHKLLNLLSTDPIGRQAYEAMCLQAALLRRHVAQIANGSEKLIIVDTGVYGSIGSYLSLGLQQEIIESVLLFHANYKQIKLRDQPPVIGLVCNEDTYTPWRPRSVSRLYWPLFEALFEPDVDSVRAYRESDNGMIVSNLQKNNWIDALTPLAGSVRGGAFDYIRSADTRRLIDADRFALPAWKALRRMIILPSVDDIELMGLRGKSVDFGFEETYTHNEEPSDSNLLQAYSKAKQSPWPEGELVSTMPKASLPILYFMETKRYFDSLMRVIVSG